MMNIKKSLIRLFLIVFFTSVQICIAQVDIPDSRNIKTGSVIPDLSYSDQPYIVKTDDGAWLCCLTTGAGHEGQSGQIVITQRSVNMGETWEDMVQIEPPSGPEASYAVMLKVPSGRVYIFYNHNTDNTREIKTIDGGVIRRVDSQGYFVFKYSDDHGKTWSDKRYPIPVREFEIDRRNVYEGKIKFFWNVGKAFTLNGKGYVPLHKVGGFGKGFFTSNQGVLLMSDNILTEEDPEKIRWETLPDGDEGLRTPKGGGPISAEQSYSVLSDGSVYCVYRSIDGYPVNTYSRDGGHTWSPPQYKTYASGGLMKHPRAANFAWKCSNGKYLYWFHNHGGPFIREFPDVNMTYNDRNPVWICGGVESDGPEGKIIIWTQPEILLYDDDPFIRMSYPDLIEDGGKYYVTETQKDVARVHEIDPGMLDKLWSQLDVKEVAKTGLVISLSDNSSKMPEEIKMPKFNSFIERNTNSADHGSKDMRNGFSIDIWFQLNSLKSGQILLDNRSPNGQGVALQTTDKGTVEIILNDGRTENRWDCDPGLIEKNNLHHLIVIVDGGPKIITFVVDGILCDGGEYRQFGWGRFSPNYRGIKGMENLRIGPSLKGRIKSLRMYDRALLTSEAIGNFREGL